MKLPITTLSLCLLAGALTLSADTIITIPEPVTPLGEILQYTTPFGIYEIGPEPFCCTADSWKGVNGDAVLTAIANDEHLGLILTHGFIACPPSAPCNLTMDTFTSAPAGIDPPLPTSVPHVPEPPSVVLVLGAGLVLAGLARRKVRVA